jgi:hypothetical protein
VGEEQAGLVEEGGEHVGGVALQRLGVGRAGAGLVPGQQSVGGERVEHAAGVGAQRAIRDREQRELSRTPTSVRSPRLPADVCGCHGTIARRSASAAGSAR